MASPLIDETQDIELLRKFSSGDASAFEVLYSKYRKSIYNFILYSIRDKDRGEDLLQEVFLRVIQQAGHFRGESKFSTWIFTIARNLCIDESRKKAVRKNVSLDSPMNPENSESEHLRQVSGTEPGADRCAAGFRMQERIAQAVETLPEEQREVFLMRQVQGMAFGEIAGVVGVSENTVKSRMRYALERLREALIDYKDHCNRSGR